MLVYAGSVKKCGYTVYFFLLNLFLKNNDCIVEVASFNQALSVKRFKLMKENKSAAFAYLFLKIIYRIEYCILIAKDP